MNDGMCPSEALSLHLDAYLDHYVWIPFARLSCSFIAENVFKKFKNILEKIRWILGYSASKCFPHDIHVGWHTQGCGLPQICNWFATCLTWLPCYYILSKDSPDHLTWCCRYIKWTKETFSAGGHKSELLPLLERCTREFHQDARYKNDIRYLRVWIQYVRT
jgi:hypothetical protein